MKLTLTRAMAEDLMESEVQAFLDDYPDRGEGQPGQRAFVVTLVNAFDRMGGFGGRGQTATLKLYGADLAYAASQTGPFATRADILADWGPEYASLARAFARRQQQAAEAAR